MNRHERVWLPDDDSELTVMGPPLIHAPRLMLETYAERLSKRIERLTGELEAMQEWKGIDHAFGVVHARLDGIEQAIKIADLSRPSKGPATDEDLAKLYAPKSDFEEFRTSTLEGLRRIYDLGVRDGAKRKISAERLTELAVIAYNARMDESITEFKSEDVGEAWEFTVGEVLEAVGLEIE